MKIRINIDGTTAAAVLDDNAVARDLSSLLPLSLTLADYADSEKIAFLPRKLSTKDAPAGSDASVGDIAYYAPWGNLAIFYKAAPYAKGLVHLVRLTSGVEPLTGSRPLKVTIEQM